jgi:hypothetical protein
MVVAASAAGRVFRESCRSDAEKTRKRTGSRSMDWFMSLLLSRDNKPSLFVGRERDLAYPGRQRAG